MIYSWRVQLYACGKTAMLKPTLKHARLEGLSIAILPHAYNCTRRLYIIISCGKSLSGYKIYNQNCGSNINLRLQYIKIYLVIESQNP